MYGGDGVYGQIIRPAGRPIVDAANNVSETVRKSRRIARSALATGRMKLRARRTNRSDSSVPAGHVYAELFRTERRSFMRRQAS